VPAVAVCGARGGVGTTTVAVGLVRALDALGSPCVLVDLDPVGHATAALTPTPPPAGASLGAALGGRWTGDAAELVHRGPTGPGVVPATGLDDVLSVLSTRAQGRLSGLVSALGEGQGWVVLDCPPGPVGRVSAFTAAALSAVAEAGGPGGGVLAVMSPAAPEVAGTAALLGRVPPHAALGIVVNGVGDSAIEASRHDVGRRLGVPVLARIPAAAQPGAVGAVDPAIRMLAEVMTSPDGLAAARAALLSGDGSGRRDATLVRLLQAELTKLSRDPDAEFDPEFELGLELLQGTHVYDRLARGREELEERRARPEPVPPARPGPSGPPQPEPVAPAASPSPAADASIHDRIHRLAPWAAGRNDGG
jgi:Mrp family chromosome partitioning ATPase